MAYKVDRMNLRPIPILFLLFIYLAFDFISASSVTASLSTSIGFSIKSWRNSNSIVDINQYQTLNVVIQGGNVPYTYNFLVYNSIGSLIANYLISNSLTTNSYTFQQMSSWGTGQFTANIIVLSDSLASISSTLTYGVNSVLSDTISPSLTQTIDNGQSVTFTSTISGGTGPYTYNWISGSSSTCTSDSLISGAGSSSYVASPSSNTYYCLQVTDSASTNAIAYSPPTLIDVNPTFTLVSWTVSSNVIPVGNPETLTATISGGTAGFAYNILVYAANGILMANSLSPSILSNTNSFTFNQPGLPGNFIANVIVIDSSIAGSQQVSGTNTYTGANGLICPSLSSTFIPINGEVYVNSDPANIFTLVTTANSIGPNTLFYINGFLSNTIIPGATSSNLVIPLANFEYTFNNLPSVIMTCGAANTGFLFSALQNVNLLASSTKPQNILFPLILAMAVIFDGFFLLVFRKDLEKDSYRPIFLMIFCIGAWFTTLPAFISLPANQITKIPSITLSSAGSNSIVGNYISTSSQTHLSPSAFYLYLYFWIPIILIHFLALMLYWREKLKRDTKLIMDNS